SGMRSRTAAANEHHERLGIDLSLQLSEKVRIRLAAWVGLPFDLDAARNSAHEIQFCARSHVHEHRSGCFLQQLECLLGQQRTLVSKLPVARTIMRRTQYFGNRPHC